jgi:uncharacterized metal-binding protein YceD (DUF177 family)
MKTANAPTPEFSRPIEVARVPNLGSHEKISADARECQALARRFKVPMIYNVTAQIKIKPWRGGGFKVSGEAHIELDQVSVISLQNFKSSQTIAVERYYLNLPPHAEDDSEFDLEPIVSGVIDIGEVVAETIALDLEPYPRMPGETFSSGAEPELPEAEKKPNPFSVLKGRGEQS